jgi:hypothetical protein
MKKLNKKHQSQQKHQILESQMEKSNRITKIQEPKELSKVEEPDSFAGYRDDIEGDDRGPSDQLIQGRLIKFTNEFEWVTRDDEQVPPDLELVAVEVVRVVQKWVDKQRMETRVIPPGEKFPDVDALNEKCPKSEWAKGPDKKLRGPWQAQKLLYLLNSDTMDKYTYATGSTGGAIAIRELVDRIKWMRRYRGAHVYPVVTLSDTFMPTRFGGRQRPHLLIKRWILLGGDGKAIEPPNDPGGQPALSGPKIVTPPSAREVTDDDIPY